MIPYLSEFLSMIPGGKEVATIALFAVLGIALSLVIKIVFSILSHLAQKTKTTLDDEILGRLSRFFYYASIITALYLSITLNYGAINIFDIALLDVYIIILLALCAIYSNRIIDVLMVWYANEISPTRKTIPTKDVFPFVRNVVKIIVYLAFIIIILGKLGIEIAPLLAGLGIAGLAVALALQDTMSNFFGGIHILADKPFREGDMIKLENGMEGTVAQIGWRTTRITTGSKNDIIIPNAKLSQSIVLNYHSPAKPMGVSYEIGVGYAEDVNAVAKTILETLNAVQKNNTKMDPQSEPWVRFERFGDWALIFKYGYTVSSYEDQFAVLDAVNKELFYAFKKNNIEIPFPVRTIYSIDQKTRDKKAKI